MKKKLFSSIVLIVAMCLLPVNFVSAASNKYDAEIEPDVYIEYLDDGSYFIVETNIDKVVSSLVASTNATSTYTTGHAIRTYYTSSGTAVCALKITGTFSYDGSTVSCVGTKSTKYSYNSAWSVEDVSTSHGSSSSTETYARADGKFVKRVLGIVTNRITTHITVYCSKNGTIS